MMKIKNVRGGITGISVEKEPLLITSVVKTESTVIKSVNKTEIVEDHSL